MGKVIVISGGSDGLGRAVATKLAAENTVVILSRNGGKLSAAARAIACEYEVCDVSDPEEVNECIARVIGRHGRIDCLINNAGVWIEGDLDTHTPEAVRHTFEVNTLGAMYLLIAVIPHMKRQKRGNIININSERGLSGKAGRSVYTASKWAVTGLTRSLQPELAPYGIAVTGIHPGKMETKLFEKAGVKKDLAGALAPTAVADLIAYVLNAGKEIVFPEISVRGIDD